MFIVSVKSSELSNSKTVCFSIWIIWYFTKRPCCQSSSAPSLSDQNCNCFVTRRWSLCGKPRYRIWHLLVAEGFTSFKARHEWMECVKTSVRYLENHVPGFVSVSWVSISEGHKLCLFIGCMFYFPLKKNGLGAREKESFSLCSQSPPLRSHPFPSPFESHHARF